MIIFVLAMNFFWGYIIYLSDFLRAEDQKV